MLRYLAKFAPMIHVKSCSMARRAGHQRARLCLLALAVLAQTGYCASESKSSNPGNAVNVHDKNTILVLEDFRNKMTELDDKIKLAQIEQGKGLEHMSVVAWNKGVSLECGSDATGESQASAFTHYVVPSGLVTRSSILKEQAKVCQRIIIARNTKHNAIVSMINALEGRRTKLRDIYDSNSAIGNLNWNFQAYQSMIQYDIAYSQQVIAAYDMQIASLSRQQDRLAKMALEGSEYSDELSLGSIGRQILQYGVLKMALEEAAR